MSISGPRACGVLGDPIEHSLSPVLHRSAYAATGLEWTYGAHRVGAGGLAEFVGALTDEWRGLSLTMPLKREAVPLVDELSPSAAMAGAVNTLVRTDDGRWTGDNTDLPGAVAAIRERTEASLTRTSWPGATILGGGATATSVGLALCEMGVGRFRILVRTPDRAQETAAMLGRHPSSPQVEVALLSDVAGPEAPVDDIIVSTIPASAQTPALVEALAGTPCLFDVVYDPWPTPLAAAAHGVVVSGLDLLVHQAALQFTLFTGVPAPLETMRQAGENALAQRQGEA